VIGVRVIAIVLIMAVVVLLVAAVAGGPLLAMRNRAEADEPTTGSGQSSGEPDASQDPAGPPS
jgi:flagellar basal body-associated protein FliL